MAADEGGKRSVVITGANSGIGLATALELAGAGYDVIGTVRSTAKGALLDEAAAAKRRQVRWVVLDVADEEATREGFAEIAGMTGGGPWAVINNAGAAQAGTVEDVPAAAARAHLEINLIAPARIAQLVLPAMRERGDGRIVNMSSIAGRVSTPMLGWYAAGKHALEALSDAMRVEVAEFGVKVILIEPGGFGTGVWAGGAGSLPERRATAYAEAYRRSTIVTGTGVHLPDPVWVARTIRIALASPMPLARYLVGVDAVTMALAETVAPTVLADYVKGLAAGLRRLPAPPFLRR